MPEGLDLQEPKSSRTAKSAISPPINYIIGSDATDSDQTTLGVSKSVLKKFRESTAEKTINSS
ncbi:hypothetical protein ACJ73_06604 [Blastomyces percursus]|uniref:Uncharacterized protein n=1 Tax=Blastomyces percursus TaxID=1658174 RepID=A0A1J9Q0G3_9EURO|nr:hypothetical protein ACJ73_06604 [Blastomyces percursus]